MLPSSPAVRASFDARFSATHAWAFEYTKCWGSLRISQMPRSGRCQMRST
jgi:hypothetical protein